MPNRFRRWARRAFGALAAILLVAVGTVYVASERKLRRTFDTTDPFVSVPTDSASIAHG